MANFTVRAYCDLRRSWVTVRRGGEGLRRTTGLREESDEHTPRASGGTMDRPRKFAAARAGGLWSKSFWTKCETWPRCSRAAPRLSKTHAIASGAKPLNTKLMIAHAGYANDGTYTGLSGPTAVIARETIASFAAVSEMLTTVGNMAVSYGVGQPLVAFQSLLRTYQALLRAQGALMLTAQQLVKAVQS
jgi:hypothetical protein